MPNPCHTVELKSLLKRISLKWQLSAPFAANSPSHSFPKAQDLYFAFFIADTPLDENGPLLIYPSHCPIQHAEHPLRIKGRRIEKVQDSRRTTIPEFGREVRTDDRTSRKTSFIGKLESGSPMLQSLSLIHI